VPPTRGRARIDQSGNYCHRNITRDVTHDRAGTCGGRITSALNAARRISRAAVVAHVIISRNYVSCGGALLVFHGSVGNFSCRSRSLTPASHHSSGSRFRGSTRRSERESDADREDRKRVREMSRNVAKCRDCERDAFTRLRGVKRLLVDVEDRPAAANGRRAVDSRSDKFDAVSRGGAGVGVGVNKCQETSERERETLVTVRFREILTGLS